MLPLSSERDPRDEEDSNRCQGSSDNRVGVAPPVVLVLPRMTSFGDDVTLFVSSLTYRAETSVRGLHGRCVHIWTVSSGSLATSLVVKKDLQDPPLSRS